MTIPHQFAKRVFLTAGIYGVVTLLPQYFMEAQVGLDFPPPIDHPEYFYGFIGVALAWQFAFLLIAHDVRRYRLIMVPAVLEKLTWGIATIMLFAQGRLTHFVVGFGLIDLVFAILFGFAFYATRTNASIAMLEELPPRPFPCELMHDGLAIPVAVDSSAAGTIIGSYNSSIEVNNEARRTSGAPGPAQGALSQMSGDRARDPQNRGTNRSRCHVQGRHWKGSD